MTSLAGSSILVIGATGGLGREIARLLSADGALLTLHGRHPERISETGIAGAPITGDLRDPGTAAQLVAAALAAHGRLDGIVNAAGLVAFGPMAEVSDETIDALLAVNATAPMRLLRAAYPALVESSGAHRDPFFLTLSGVVSESPTANMAAYSASKAALAAFGKAAGRELRRDGIRFLDARPGHTETGLATRPIQGSAPRLPTGYSPANVARRLVDAIIAGERDLPSTAFAG
ncbi:cyclic-di-GMP-binding biofilm dispersal mediator protein [Cryobacterium flavum]|uniref:Cyclic-di-GMP-binding biofilm dispersal mediator protein n=1 Tax=Cryobacterium flavum TaxID=1424659 RepID=A0A4R8V5U0_9MICO|nr:MULTISPECIES: SDR family oxidoreductase [Cryobacterium]TFB77824.1 SDR family oxidoreductase [Cryobacterium flavum]SDM61744.1 cyclic-di-GMP-binding biofilm dispersal mediator protein [Cryobacterium flavum]